MQESAEKKALNTPGGGELWKLLGGPAGLPYFAFLDSRGALIVNSTRPPDAGGKHGGNIGHPVQPYEIDWFMAMLPRAAPGMPPGEAATLEKWLRSQKK